MSRSEKSHASERRDESLTGLPRETSLVTGFGRFLGMISGAAVLVLSVYFVATFEPPAPHIGHGGIVEHEGHGYDARLGWIPTMVGSVLAIWGGFVGRPLIVVLGFAASALWSFTGILYALLVPWGPLSVLGWGHIGYLVGAACLGWGRYRDGR